MRTGWQIAHGDTEDTLACSNPVALIKHTAKLTTDLWSRPRANASTQVVHLFAIHIMAISVRHTGFTPEGSPIAGVEDAKKSVTFKCGEQLADTGGYPSEADIRLRRPMESELDALARQEDKLTRGLVETCVKLEQDDAKRRRTLADSSGARGSAPKKTRSDPAPGGKYYTPTITEIHKQLTQLRDKVGTANRNNSRQPYQNQSHGARAPYVPGPSLGNSPGGNRRD